MTNSEKITIHGLFADSPSLIIPFIDVRVSAGFPSPAAPHAEEDFDLNHFIDNPNCTYLLSLDGESMAPTIPNGARLIVDCTRVAKHNDVVIATVNGEMTCKRLFKGRIGEIYLMADNPKHENIYFGDSDEMSIFGVVIGHLDMYGK